jgi:hypothetical protein
LHIVKPIEELQALKQIDNLRHLVNFPSLSGIKILAQVNIKVVWANKSDFFEMLVKINLQEQAADVLGQIRVD